MNHKLKMNIPYLYIFKNDYKILNQDGVWNIKHGTDYDTLISPLFEPELRKEFILDNSGYFIDIGSHIWKWSLFVANQNLNNKVLAIEINKYTYSYLQKNIIDNDLAKQITPVNIWLSDKKTSLVLDYDLVNTWTSWIWLCKQWKDIERIQVNVISFDDLLEQYNISTDEVRLIKIDVEGHEWSVFEGMVNFLSKKIKKIKIICEIHDTNPDKKKIIEKLMNYWFNLKFVDWNSVDHIFYK